jgi:hypothetical protein
VRSSTNEVRLRAVLLRMGFQAIVEPGMDGDIRVQFSNSDEFGRFVAKAISLLSGDEVLRIGSGCLATFNRHAATLICDRAE